MVPIFLPFCHLANLFFFFFNHFIKITTAPLGLIYVFKAEKGKEEERLMTNRLPFLSYWPELCPMTSAGCKGRYDPPTESNTTVMQNVKQKE